MKPAYTDPRIVRTRAALRDALGTLLREHSFEALTLNEIATASGLNRATIYKHHPDKFALLDSWIADEFQTRLLAANSGGEWSGPSKLAGVIAAACQCLQWVAALGRPDDRLLRPIAEARIRALLQHAIHYGLAEKLVIAVAKPDFAAALASAAIYGAAEAWTHTTASSQRALDSYVSKVIAALVGILVPNPKPPPRSNRPLEFE